MFKLVENKPTRRKTKIDLHDKQVLTAVSEAIARIKHADVTAKDCRNEARTVISAYVLGQDAEMAAQRLLNWWCIDCGVKPLTITQGQANTASVETIARVRASALAGYAALEGVEKYGTAWIAPEPANVKGSPGVPPR
jgi:hypothetical protein